MAINILTCNMNGLNNPTKRANFFGFLQNSSFDLILLQETGSGPNTVKRWGDEWLSASIWNSGPSSSCCGVAVLSKPNIELQELNRDKHGRMLSAAISYEKNELKIINVYAPNVPSERYDFFDGLHNFSKDTGLLVILTEGFNMVESVALDTQGLTTPTTIQAALRNSRTFKQN